MARAFAIVAAGFGLAAALHMDWGSTAGVLVFGAFEFSAAAWCIHDEMWRKEVRKRQAERALRR